MGLTEDIKNSVKLYVDFDKHVFYSSCSEINRWINLLFVVMAIAGVTQFIQKLSYLNKVAR